MKKGGISLDNGIVIAEGKEYHCVYCGELLEAEDDDLGCPGCGECVSDYPNEFGLLSEDQGGLGQFWWLTAQELLDSVAELNIGQNDRNKSYKYLAGGFDTVDLVHKNDAKTFIAALRWLGYDTAALEAEWLKRSQGAQE